MFVQTQPATPVDELQQRLFEVIGGEDPQEVLPLVEAQLMVARRELRAIPERARQRGADFEQAAREPMESLLEQFRRYQTWLTGLQQALEEGNHQAYVQAHEEAQSLVPELMAALENYSRFFASHGPYASPWSNTLARIAGAIGAGELGEDDWDETLASFERAFSEKLNQLQALQLPGKTACLGAYREAGQAVGALQNVESFQEDHLKPHLLALEEGSLMGDRLEKLMSEGLQGPTAMPVANVVIAMAERTLAGELEGDLAASVINDYKTMLDRFWDGFERSVNRPQDSALVHQEIPRALEAGDQHDQALEDLQGALEAQDAPRARAAIEALIQTAARLNESREVFETAARNQTHAVCPGCGRANPPENRRCEACGAVLPTEAGSGASSTFNVLSGPALEETQELGMTENVARLFRACDEVAEGQLSPEEFKAVVTEAVTGLKDFSNDLEEIALEMLDESQMPEEVQKVWRETHLPYVQEVASHFAAGISDCEAGLASMLAFLEDGDREHLSEGVRTVWEGLGVIHRARLAMNSNLQMFQDLLQEARESGLPVDESAQEG